MNTYVYYNRHHNRFSTKPTDVPGLIIVYVILVLALLCTYISYIFLLFFFFYLRSVRVQHHLPVPVRSLVVIVYNLHYIIIILWSCPHSLRVREGSPRRQPVPSVVPHYRFCRTSTKVMFSSTFYTST